MSVWCQLSGSKLLAILWQKSYMNVVLYTKTIILNSFFIIKKYILFFYIFVFFFLKFSIYYQRMLYVQKDYRWSLMPKDTEKAYGQP